MELLNAALDGNVQTVRKLIKEQPELINWKNENGWTALMISARNGHTDVVMTLLEHGSDVNKAQKNGWTALMESSKNGHTDVVRILLEHGSDINKTEEIGITALMYGAVNGHSNTVRILVERGADIDTQTNEKATALMFSAMNGHSDTVRILLEHEADMNRQSNLGNTALHHCLGNLGLSYNQHTRVTVALLMIDRDIAYVNNKKGKSPIDIYEANDCTKYNTEERTEQKEKLLQILKGGPLPNLNSIPLDVSDGQLPTSASKPPGGYVPVEIFARGLEARAAFIEAIEEGKTEVHQGRTVVMGLERVGKTSLINSFLKKEFNPHEDITDALATKTTCIQESSDDWQEAPEEKSNLAKIFEDKVDESIAKTVMKNKTILKEKTVMKKETESKKGKVMAEKPATTTEPNESIVDKKKKMGFGKSISQEKEAKDHNKMQGSSHPLSSPSATTATPSSSVTLSTSAPPQAVVAIEKVLENIPKQADKKMISTSQATTKWQESKDEFIMNIWDFGGQPIYHIIQRIFIVSFAVVCVVFNLEDDLDAPALVRDPTTGKTYQHRMTYLDFILFWIRTAYTNSKGSELDGRLSPPIYIIGTHRNSVGETEDDRESRIKEKIDKIWNALKGKPYEQMVLKIFATENSLPFHMSNAADIMREIIESSKKMERCLPLKWLFVHQEIQKLKEEHIYQKTSEIIALLDRCRVKEGQRPVLLQYLHDTGEILYYPHDKALQDIIVIDLMQVVILAKAIITAVDPEFQDPKLRAAWRRLDSGVLEEPLLRHLWDEFITSDVMFNFFVSLLQRFGLLCERKITEGEERLFLVLARLKPTPVTSPTEDYGNRAISIYHDFSNYLPDDLFQRGATKFIEEFQMENYEPKLLYERVELDIDEDHHVILSVDTIKQRRMFKTTIIRRKILNSDIPDSEPKPSVCKKVLNFLKAELKIFCQSGRGVDVKMYIPCECCQDTHWHIVKSFNRDVLPCGSNGMEVKRYRRLFGDDIPEPKHDESQAPVCPSSTIEGFVDEAIMQTIAEEMDLSWKRLGLRLGLKMSTIVKINNNHLPTAIFTMLNQWRNGIGSENHQARMLYTALWDHGQKSLAASLFVTHELYTKSLSVDEQIRSDVGFTDQDLLFICKLLLNHAAATGWRRLGVRLGLKWAKVNNLADERETPDNIIKMLICWRNEHPDRQIQTMVNALKEQKLPKIAKHVCKRHSYEDKSEERPSKLQKMVVTGCMNDMDFVFMSEMMDADWQHLGSCLSIKKNELDAIKMKFPDETADATVETLVRWSNRQENDENHLTVLTEKLKEIGRNDIVEELNERFEDKKMMSKV